MVSRATPFLPGVSQAGGIGYRCAHDATQADWRRDLDPWEVSSCFSRVKRGNGTFRESYTLKGGDTLHDETPGRLVGQERPGRFLRQTGG